jgi:hypothetical protein
MIILNGGYTTTIKNNKYKFKGLPIDSTIINLLIDNNCNIKFKIKYSGCEYLIFHNIIEYKLLNKNTYTFMLNKSNNIYFDPVNIKDNFKFKLKILEIKNNNIYEIKSQFSDSIKLSSDQVLPKLNVYKENNDLELYLNYSNKRISKRIIMKFIDNKGDILTNNNFNVDYYFYKYINNIKLENKLEILQDISDNGFENGLIYYPKQIINLFGIKSNDDNSKEKSGIMRLSVPPDTQRVADQATQRVADHYHDQATAGLPTDIDLPSDYTPDKCSVNQANLELIFLEDNNKNIIIEYKNKREDIKTFIKRELYDKDFNWYLDNFIRIYENKLINTYPYENELLLIVFIGNDNVGNTLLDKIISYKEIQSSFILSVCFRNEKLYELYKNKVITNFDNYILYITNEFGSDIVPSLLVYNDIKKRVNFNKIIKLQTKNDTKWFNELTDYLLKKKLDELEVRNNNCLSLCNCLGHPNKLICIETKLELTINTKLNLKYKSFTNKKYFIAGTIFYCDKIVFEKVLKFIENNNYRSLFTNNMYDTNLINATNSYVHYLERLFGIININE